MRVKRQRFYLWLLGLSYLLAGCGANTNLNSLLWVDAEDKNRFDVQLALARENYDRGQFSAAKGYAEKAYAISPHSERAAQILGFVYLALAGIDVFTIIEKMSDFGKDDDDKKSSSSDDSLNILSTLAAQLLTLSESDFEKLGTLDNTSNSFFSNLPVYIPNRPGDAKNAADPRASVATLYWLNKAIEVICPFIAPEVRQESTHSRYSCAATKGETFTPAQSYLLFAMAHLVETLSFNVVLLYTSESATRSALALADASSGQTNSNLFKRANKLSTKDVTLDKMGDYAEAVASLKEAIDAVFDTSQGSMLSETLLNLRMVVAALGQIDGIPDEVTRSLNNALNSVEQTAKKAGQSTSGLESQTSALKQQLNSQIVTKVNTGINTVLTKYEDTVLTPEQRENATKMCDAADSLLKGTVGIEAPERCKKF